jgi:PelA/Pel-15E family pectate lyase
MPRRRHTLTLVPLLLLAATLPAPAARKAPGRPPGERADFIVAQDGSGDFRAIQPALDAIPKDNPSNKIILVRNGVYREKVHVAASHVSIVGEDRDATRIEYAELRKIWRETHPDDYGAAVINIADGVTDLVLANLTVRNDYGKLHDEHDHQFAIRSGANTTRISILHAKIIADGGDTLSLWNPVSGMYYHSDCDFEGWVDYVCPRGWAYITNSRFFGHNLTASIWHDGSRDLDSKFVIRRSRFDGVKDFPLGRNNRDGQFFLLDCRFSQNMADRPIYRPSAQETYLFPARYYYWNDHRDGGDYSWFADNLASADTAPYPRAVTARWTFAGRWDPEAELPAVLPFASVPRPAHEESDVTLFNPRLRWIPGRNATSHRVYFGTSNPPRFRGEQRETTFDPGPLDVATTYFWRVDSVTPGGAVQGPTWTFTTAATVRFALVGDSTVTDDSGWGRGFTARLTSRATVVNLARNGRSSKSYIDEGHWRSALAQGADVVLIQFGHNDQPGKGPERETDPATTYRANLARCVDEARAAAVFPVVVTSLTRRFFDDAGKIASDLFPYADAAKVVAAEKGAPVVDLHAASIALLNRLGPSSGETFGVHKDDGTLDRTHLSKDGSAAFGAIVAGELRKAVPALAAYIKAPDVAVGPPPAGPTPSSQQTPGLLQSRLRSIWFRCLEQADAWYGTAEAIRIADLVRLYQRKTGGWPKNIDMARALGADEVRQVEAAKADTDSTIDNAATTTQLRFLARVFAATRAERFEAAVADGLDYLLAAQYPNGGWPQFYPLRADYSRHITFNDNAMVNVMEVLRDVGAGAAPYGFVDAARRARAAAAAARGLKVMLAAQIRVNGRLTAWCAQHDEVTLEPRGARTYEHPSLSGSESVGVVSFLMSIPKPDAPIVAAVEAAVAWFRDVRIAGLRLESRPDAALPGGFDRVVVKDPAAPPLWARFYEIGTNRPIFSGRDGVIRYNLAEIEYERRANYSWYGDWPAALLERDYPAWARSLKGLGTRR